MSLLPALEGAPHANSASRGQKFIERLDSIVVQLAAVEAAAGETIRPGTLTKRRNKVLYGVVHSALGVLGALFIAAGEKMSTGDDPVQPMSQRDFANRLFPSARGQDQFTTAAGDAAIWSEGPEFENVKAWALENIHTYREGTSTYEVLKSVLSSAMEVTGPKTGMIARLRQIYNYPQE